MGEADQTLARVFDLKGGIDGKRYRDRECDGIKPTPRDRIHAVTGEKSTAPGKNEAARRQRQEGAC